jgi:tetratricopeptide (TPR) repeat protein
MRIISFLWLIAFMGFVNAVAAPLADLEEAERHYREGNFEQAADIYQSILRQGLASGELYYNLGNCYYKLGLNGLAVLNYERAARFLGDDPSLQTNQKLAYLKSPDKIEPLPQWLVLQVADAVRRIFSVNGWARLLIAMEWLSLLCFMGLLSGRWLNMQRWLSRVFWVSMALLILSGACFGIGYYQQSRMVEGVVLTASVQIHSAPDQFSTGLFTLHEGAKIRILRRLPGWAEIHLADGKQGWMSQDAFEVI